MECGVSNWSKNVTFDGAFRRPAPAAPCAQAQLEDPRNLSRIFRCPNEKACPGGIVSAAESFGQPPETVQAMCASGFEGLG